MNTHKRFTVITDRGGFIVFGQDAAAVRRKMRTQGHTVREVRPRQYEPPPRAAFDQGYADALSGLPCSDTYIQGTNYRLGYDRGLLKVAANNKRRAASQ